MKLKLVLILILVMVVTACVTENVELSHTIDHGKTSSVQARTGRPILSKEKLARDPTFLDLVKNSEITSYVGAHAATVFGAYAVDGLSDAEIRKAIEDAPQQAFEEGSINQVPIYCTWKCVSEYGFCLLETPEPGNCWAEYIQCINGCLNGGVGRNPDPIF